MGIWGTAIFSDDNAADLRDEYRDLVGAGVDGSQATDRLIAKWNRKGDPNLEPVFWLALSMTQWNCGRLEERVKAEALRVIEDRWAMRPWLGSLWFKAANLPSFTRRAPTIREIQQGGLSRSENRPYVRGSRPVRYPRPG
jgi:hypothetical protein